MDTCVFLARYWNNSFVVCIITVDMQNLWHFIVNLFIALGVFYAPVSKDRGHIVLPLSVCPSICPSVCLHKLKWKLYIFPFLLNYFSYKAHIWYEGTSHRYTSPGTKVKIIYKGQGQISGSCFSKDGCFGDISVSQTHLGFFFFLTWVNY